MCSPTGGTICTVTPSCSASGSSRWRGWSARSRACGPGSRPPTPEARAPRPAGTRAQAGRLLVHDLDRGALDACHQPVDLDRMRQVIEEEDQRPQAHEKQHDRNGDGKLRIGDRTPLRRLPHRVQPSRRVGKGSDHHRQEQLIGPVPQEVAQHARRVLGRGQLEGNQGEPEDQRDDRDDRTRDPDQQRPGVAHSSLEQQTVQGRMDTHLHPRQQRPQDNRCHHQTAGRTHSAPPAYSDHASQRPRIPTHLTAATARRRGTMPVWLVQASALRFRSRASFSPYVSSQRGTETFPQQTTMHTARVRGTRRLRRGRGPESGRTRNHDETASHQQNCSEHIRPAGVRGVQLVKPPSHCKTTSSGEDTGMISRAGKRGERMRLRRGVQTCSCRSGVRDG